jgi:hypothetical protein
VGPQVRRQGQEVGEAEEAEEVTDAQAATLFVRACYEGAPFWLMLADSEFCPRLVVGWPPSPATQWLLGVLEVDAADLVPLEEER